MVVVREAYNASAMANTTGSASCKAAATTEAQTWAKAKAGEGMWGNAAVCVTHNVTPSGIRKCSGTLRACMFAAFGMGTTTG